MEESALMSAQTVADLCSHVETLCSKHSIALEYRRSGGRSWRKTRRISVGPVLSNVTYAVALHEIGHILGRSPARRLDREASAWQWARENALEWTPRMEAKMQSCLDSYAKWFLRKWRRGVNIAPSSAFDLLRREALTMLLPRPTRRRVL
jgi:hypothetical protein